MADIVYISTAILVAEGRSLWDMNDSAPDFVFTVHAGGPAGRL